MYIPPLNPAEPPKDRLTEEEIDLLRWFLNEYYFDGDKKFGGTTLRDLKRYQEAMESRYNSHVADDDDS